MSDSSSSSSSGGDQPKPTPTWAPSAPFCPPCRFGGAVTQPYTVTAQPYCVDKKSGLPLEESLCTATKPRPALTQCPAVPTCKMNQLPKKGVIWSYLCGTTLQSLTSGPGVSNDLTVKNSLVNLITSQKVNYLCLGFLEVGPNGVLSWNITGGCQTDYDALDAQLASLHKKGVCISASIGGENSAAQYKMLTDPASTLDSFENLRTKKPYLDGIDFDIEALSSTDFPALGNAINAVAKVFKARGYVVTAAPTASQISPGCGGNKTGNGTSNQALVNLDMNYIDGIMIQWYEGGSENGNGGQSPATAQGIVNFLIALSGQTKTTGYSANSSNNGDNPPIGVGACRPEGAQQGANTWKSCNSTCYTFPTSKIAIGIQTYAPGCTANSQFNSGADTAQIVKDAVSKLQSHDIPFLGVASWAIYNVFCSKPRYTGIFPAVYAQMK